VDVVWSSLGLWVDPPLQAVIARAKDVVAANAASWCLVRTAVVLSGVVMDRCE
jgi:hypothetical protein